MKQSYYQCERHGCKKIFLDVKSLQTCPECAGTKVTFLYTIDREEEGCLILTAKCGDTIYIGDSKVRIERHPNGGYNQYRVRVIAKRGVMIYREKALQKIKAEQP